MNNFEIDEDGTKYWYDYQGQIHREGGPAIIYLSRTKRWYKHGQLHNDNGFPAEIWSTGDMFWYKYGKLHNDFGPAIIWSNKSKYRFIDGKELTEKEFLQHKIKNFICGDDKK